MKVKELEPFVGKTVVFQLTNFPSGNARFSTPRQLIKFSYNKRDVIVQNVGESFKNHLPINQIISCKEVVQ